MKKNGNIDMFQKAEAYMRENISKKLYVSEVAKYIGVSTSCLEKNFSKITNFGVMRYFLNMKLEHAAKMLKSGAGVGEVARQLNFYSTTHFSVAFKKMYGVSPIRYKYPKN